MAYSYVIPDARFPSGATKRWLVAYPTAQILCSAAIAALAEASSRLPSLDLSYISLPSIDLSHLSAQLTAAAPVIVALVYGLTFGFMRGVVLREKLARFSMPIWCLTIAAVSLFILPPEPEALQGLTRATAANLQATALVTMPVAISGMVYGLVIGVAEAITLRRAASGLLTWIVISGIAWGIGHLAASAIASVAPLAQITTVSPLALHWGYLALQAAIAGAILLPALRLIRPRLSHYGPRVYREALRTSA